ncbi:hypothetical protein [Lacticaseibacillus pantheris]|jgi:hypothetical protein|uniref:hypothetical protein n=1 Tax=Lacticaseibacillus pantheris TaxID=171523 RepID=UPI0006CFF0F5|nr:hypothetical protein [Lacticaseibacillus pantheris]WKF84871.1 hypothetical protein QY874_11420 [Lacticaseibacillus pantheris]
MHTVGLVLPLVWLVVTLALWVLVRHRRRGLKPLLLLIPVVNGAGIILLTWSHPDYLFVCAFATCLVALIWVGVTIYREYDLLFKRYFTQLAGILGVLSTVWWVGAIIWTA